MHFSAFIDRWRPSTLRATCSTIAPGVASTLIVALAATYLSDHYHAPPVIFALLLAALGMKTSLREMMAVGTTAIALIAAETIFLALLVLSWITLVGSIR